LEHCEQDIQKSVAIFDLPQTIERGVMQKLKLIVEKGGIKQAIGYGAQIDQILAKNDELKSLLNGIIQRHSKKYINKLRSKEPNYSDGRTEDFRSAYFGSDLLVSSHAAKNPNLIDFELTKLVSKVEDVKKTHTARLFMNNQVRILRLGTTDKAVYERWWSVVIRHSFSCFGKENFVNLGMDRSVKSYGLYTKYADAKPNERLSIVITKLHKIGRDKVKFMEIVLLCSNTKMKDKMGLKYLGTTLLDNVIKLNTPDYLIAYSDPSAVGFYEDYGFMNHRFLFGDLERLTKCAKLLCQSYSVTDSGGNRKECPFYIYKTPSM